MKILITGANGYIGKSLYNAFKNKHDVTAITRNEYDLTDHNYLRRLFRSEYYDVVLHCAVTGGHRLKQDNWDVMDSNLRMYYNLLDYKCSYGKLIHFGSGADLYTNTPYGLSKKVIANSISEIEGFRNIRIFGVFDENELDTRFIKSNLIRYINKQPMEIHNDKLMDFFYMKDLILLVEHCMTNNYNSSTDCTYTNSLKLSEIADIINKLDSYQVDININDPKSIESYVGGFNDIVLPYIGLVRGIKETYNKLKEQYEAN